MRMVTEVPDGLHEDFKRKTKTDGVPMASAVRSFIEEYTYGETGRRTPITTAVVPDKTAVVSPPKKTAPKKVVVPDLSKDAQSKGKMGRK